MDKTSKMSKSSFNLKKKPMHYDQKVKEKVQKLFFSAAAGFEPTPLLVRRINWSLRPLGHRDMLRFKEQFEVLNYSKNRSIFGWSSRPRKALKGQNSGCGLCFRPLCIT